MANANQLILVIFSFTAPNDVYGIYNNGDVPLKFVVVREQAK